MGVGNCIAVILFLGALMGAPASLRAQDPAEELESHADDVSEADVARLLNAVPSLEGEWTLFEIPMLRLLAANPEVIHPAALRDATETIEYLLTLFDEDGSLRADLRRRPIRFLHGLTRPEVSLLAGIETDGLALWEPRIILSRRFPHAHELVHIIAHLGMSSAEIAGVEPVLREGLASYLGGARGRSPQVVLSMGDAYLDLGLGDPAAMLGPDRFFHGAAEPAIHYATSARFVQFLVEQHGWGKFEELYRVFASNGSTVGLRPADSRMLQFAGVYQRPWELLWEEFHSWRRQNPVPGISEVVTPMTAPDLELGADGRKLRMWEEAGSWVVELRAEVGYPEVQLSWGRALPESFRSRQRVSIAAGSLRRYALVLRPAGVELRDLALDETRLATAPRPLTDPAEAAAQESQGFCVRLSFAEQLPPWPRDPDLWASPRLR